MAFQIFILFIQSVLVLLLLIWGVKKEGRFLYLIAFLIPLMSLSVNIGVLLTWQRMIFPLAIIALILGKHHSTINMRVMRFLLLFLVYATIVTILTALLDYDTGKSYRLGEALGWGPAQAKYRYWIQLATTISIWGVALIPAWFMHSDKDLISIINGYINGNLVSVLVGFYQILAIRLGLPGSNFNWFIGAEKGVFRDTGAYDVFGSQIYRLSGLSGEPKHSGSFILSALILILVIEFFAPPRFRVQKAGIKILIFLTGILLTFSSGSWLVVIIVLGILLVSAMLRGRRIAFSYALLIGLLGLFLVLFLGINMVSSAVEYRVSGRFRDGLESIAQYEPKDGAFIYFAQENPDKLLWGSGAGGLDFRLIPYLYELNPIFLQRGGTVTPTYFYTRFLGEFGFIGLILLLGLVIDWIKAIPVNSDYAWGRTFIVVGTIALVATSSVSLMGYLLIAAAIAVRSVQNTATLPQLRESARRFQISQERK